MNFDRRGFLRAALMAPFIKIEVENRAFNLNLKDDIITPKILAREALKQLEKSLKIGKLLENMNYGDALKFTVKNDNIKVGFT